MKRLLPVLALFCAQAFASVTITASFKGPTQQPVTFAYITLDLTNCGYNVPSVPGLNASLVQKHIVLTPNQLPATIYANNEITCGNAYSTLWHVTAWANSNTKIAGDADYALCSSLSNCVGGAVTASWNLAQSQPFEGTPPPPGYESIFGNPVQNQIINQPVGSTLTFQGLGAFNFPNGFNLGPVMFSQLGGLTGLTNVMFVSDALIGSNPCTGGGTGSLAVYNLGAWSCAFGSGGGGGSGLPNGAVTFSSATSVVLPTSYNTPNLLWSCWDSNAPANALFPAQITLNLSTFSETFTFPYPESGFCVTNGNGSAGVTPVAPGSDTQILFNHAGALGANAALTYNYSSSALINAPSGVFTNTQINLYTQSIINGCGGNLFSGTFYRTDALYGCVFIPASSAVAQSGGVTGYIVNRSTATNGVGGYLVGQAGANGVNAWGANEVASDNSYLGNFINTILYGNEVDLGVNDPSTTGYGLFLSGTATQISTHTFGIQIIPFNSSAFSPYYIGINCGTGATTSGACLNALPIATGVNHQSQTVAFVSESSGAVFNTTTLFNDAPGNFHIGPGTGLQVIVGAGGLGIPGSTSGQNTLTAPAIAGSASTVLPAAGGTVLATGNGAGNLIQTKRTGGCTTTGGASAFTGACTTTVTWTNTFADGNYTVSCTANGITSGVPLLQSTTTILGASTVVQTQQATGVNAAFVNIECIAVHD